MPVRLIARESAADEARPCRSADAADRARHQAIRHRLRGARSHRGDHRPRQLYRAARRVVGGARHCAGRRQAGGRPDHADGLRRGRGQRRAASIRSSPRSMRGTIMCIFRWSAATARSLIRPRVAPVEEALEASRFGAPLSGRQCRGNPRRTLAGRCASAGADRSAAGARHRLGRLARRRGQSGHRAGAAVLSARARRQTSNRPAAESRRSRRAMMAVAVRPVGRRHARWSSPRACATRRAWRSCTAHRFIAAGARRIRGHAEPSATRWCTGCGWGRNSSALRCRGWPRTRPKFCRSRSTPSHRGRGLSRNLLLTHLGHLAGRGVRTVFLEVEENNQPARRLYDRAGFRRCRAPRALLPGSRAGNN